MNFIAGKKKANYFNYKSLVIIFSIILVIFGLVFLNFHFKVKNISIEFFDQVTENQDIKNYTEDLARKNANNLLSYIFLDEDMLKKLIRDEFKIVGGVKISKSYNLNLGITISKNQEFFYTCVPEETGFLVRCILGNVDGEYYKEISDTDIAGEKLNKVSIEINANALYDLETNRKNEVPDSLSGNRIYTKEDFVVLREIINWMQKNGFKITKIYVDDLKIVDVYTDQYKIKVSLEKGYVDTVKDFELISRAGKLQKYINEKKEDLEYIDLSYKDKVFFKLKNATQNDIMSTTTATTTATGTSVN
jgi:DNA-binding transcriptional MerR regulator